jgi:hemerythrin
MEYSPNHFAAEEKLMEQHHYPHPHPRLRPHRAEHQQFTSKLLAFKEDFQKGKQGVVTALLPTCRPGSKTTSTAPTATSAIS